jgi:hypothetical protein
MWEAANPSPAIFGGRGCGAQRAAWLSSLTAENAHLAKQEYAQTLIDLVKAFERIPHHVLVAFAIKWQYCLMTLRLSLAAYRLARIICIDGVCSRFVSAARGITAGAGMATSELRLFMLDLITSSLRLFPWVRHTLYVDDLTLERRGTVEAAPRQLADATDFAVRYLQEKLLAEVSPTKTVYLTSSRQGARKFRGRLKTSKVKFTKSTKLLGTQTVAGRRRSTAILRGRLQSFKKKIPRIQRLRAAGINVRQITSAVGVPAFFYGAQCSGVSDTHLEAARRDVAKAVGTSTRGSHHDRALYMCDVAGSRLDPAFDAHALPLQYYALAWWESWAEPYELRQHFASAWRKLAAAKWNWNQVTGPITAVLATANRLKWHFTSAHRVVTDQDRVLDLLRDPPAYVVKQVNAAVRRWQLARVIRLVPNIIQRASTTTYSGAKITSKLLPADVIADSKALSSLLGSRWGTPKDVKGLWTRDSRPWLHSTAIGAQWPQARVAAVPGWSDDSSCQLCGHIPGNLAHRAQCPGNTPCGGWPAPSAMAQAGLDRLSQQQRDILLGTGLMVVQLPIPAPPQLEEIQWLLPLDASTAPDDIRWYIDGSLIDPMTPFQRLGAGLVGIAGDRPVAIATATPPEWIDTIPGAEAWSLYAVLAMCCRFPEVLTDCLGNRRTLLSGRGVATAASRPLARVWSAIFACCEDSLLQELDAMLTWGPAHTSWASLGTRLKSNGRPLTAVDWRANGIADAAAKMAASRHRAPAYIRQRYAEAVAAHRFGAAVAGVACWEANHHKSLTVDADGSVKHVLIRDSIGRQGHQCHGISDEPSVRAAAKPTSADAAPEDADLLANALPPDFQLLPNAMPLYQAVQYTDAALACETPLSSSSSSCYCGSSSSSSSSNGYNRQHMATKPRRSSQPDVRGIAVQAAAFANCMAGRASLPTADWLHPSEVDPRIQRIAAQLASSAQAFQHRENAPRIAGSAADQAVETCTRTEPESPGKSASDRRSFLEQLRRTTAALASAKRTSPADAHGDAARRLPPPAPVCRTRNSAVTNWRNGISDARRRLMG